MRVEGAAHRDRVVGDLADRQHGVVSREQLLGAGVGRGAVARGVESGRLRPVFRGVYAVGDVALRREGCWMAALLACGSTAVLSHRTAAMVWGLLITRPPRARRRDNRRDEEIAFEPVEVAKELRGLLRG
jgi:hypothetical protein